MVRKKQRGFKWGKMIIALILATFGLYFLVAGFIMQSGGKVIIPLISYLIGLVLLVEAKVFKRKSVETD